MVTRDSDLPRHASPAGRGRGHAVPNTSERAASHTGNVSCRNKYVFPGHYVHKTSPTFRTNSSFEVAAPISDPHDLSFCRESHASYAQLGIWAGRLNKSGCGTCRNELLIHGICIHWLPPAYPIPITGPRHRPVLRAWALLTEGGKQTRAAPAGV